MNAIKVSIIVPVYNICEYIERCLISLCGQTLTEIEIICINDGSTDESLNILMAYAAKDNRIQIINQENMGVSSARNRGLDLARGEYISFVDGDDYLETFALEELYCFAKQNNADAVIFGANIINDFPELPSWIRKTTNPKNSFYPEFDPRVLFEETGSRPYIWSHFVNRKIIEEHAFRMNEQIKIGEDQLFALCYLPFAKNIFFIEKKYYNYLYGRTNSATCIFDAKIENKFEIHIKLISIVIAFYKKQKLLKKMDKYVVEWIIDFLYGDFKKLSNNNQRTNAEIITQILYNAKVNHIKKALNNIQIIEANEMMTKKLKLNKVKKAPGRSIGAKIIYNIKKDGIFDTLKKILRRFKIIN